MRKLFVILLSVFSAGNLLAQNLPAFRQFYFNPFLFNPAFTAIDGYTEVVLIHRQQWLGFNDAPVASGLALQHATYSRVSLGFTALTQESVALRNTSAKGTLAYKIPISKHHVLSFGISVGVGYNDLDLEQVDYSNDPTILNAADSKVYADGNFGALYTWKNLKIGFALPRLFGQPYISPQLLNNNTVSQLKNQFYSLSYKIEFGTGVVSVEPYFLYRLNRDDQNSWEAVSIIYFKDKIWAGGSYHETQGVGFFFGMLIKEKLKFGYSYELPPIDKEFASTSSHEFHINLRLGKKKVVGTPPSSIDYGAGSTAGK